MSEDFKVINHPSWTHMLVFFVILILAVGGAFSGGYLIGVADGQLKQVKAQPPFVNSGNGPVTIDQTTKKAGYMFGIKPAKAWGIGICHD